jgi:hypothetical protein
VFSFRKSIIIHGRRAECWLEFGEEERERKLEHLQ